MGDAACRKLSIELASPWGITDFEHGIGGLDNRNQLLAVASQYLSIGI